MIKTPYYIVYENKLRKNLELISSVSKRANVKIIMAFKANALWKTFGIISDYCRASTASSLNEMRLSLEEFGGEVHAYCPVYTDDTIAEFVKGCSHITFNSVAQFTKYREVVESYNATHADRVSCGLRINPECSVIETDIYNPCMQLICAILFISIVMSKVCEPRFAAAQAASHPAWPAPITITS